MKKVLFITVFFIGSLIYFFIGNKERISKVSYNLDDKYYTYIIDFDNFKSTELINTFKSLDIQILKIEINEIINYEFIPLSNNIKEIYKELTNNYKKFLLNNGYDEEAITSEIKGFIIDSIYVLAREKDLKNIDNCKIFK